MRDQISWIVVPVKEVEGWFHQFVQAPSRPEVWYESNAINFAIHHADKIVHQQPKQIWVEQYLGQKDDLGRLRPDLLFVTSNELWIIEVKHRLYEQNLITANDQVWRYSKRIKRLEWWPSKAHRLRIFWTYMESDEKRYNLKPWDSIPSEQLDFINRKRILV